MSITKLALPPLIPSNVDFQTAVVSLFQVGELQAKTVEATLFTDGFAIWTGGEMSDMSKISGLLLPTDPSDAASKEYVDASLGGNPGLPLTSVQFNDGGTFGGSSLFTFDSALNVLTVGDGLVGKITGISTAGITGATDAVNKAYVDASSSGSPGGVNTNIQFNDSTNFGGSNNLTWSSGTQTMTVTGTVNSTNVVATSISGTTVIGDTLTDNIATLTGGVLTDILDVTFLDDNVTNTTITMGLNAGSTNGLGIISGLQTLTGLSSDFDAANKAYVDAATGSAPGLPTSSIQFNSSPAGVFTGSSEFLWNDLSKTMTVTGTITDGTASLVGGALSGVTTIGSSGIVTLTNATPSTLSTNGALVVTGGVGIGDNLHVLGDCFASEFYTVSDIRLKENIAPLENSLDKISEIGCYSYNMIGSGIMSYGVLAQQLEEVGFNDMVRETSRHKTVNYLQFIALLIDGMNELREQVTDLNELRDEVSKLKKFKMDSIKDSLNETYAPSKVVINNFKTVKTNKNTVIRAQDRKKYKGITYKHCFDCSQWTPEDNFLKDSSQPDFYRKSCKKH